jgi:hypothetical protein
MTPAEIEVIAFSGLTPEYRAELLADIFRDDATWSIFGWHEHLPIALVRAWPALDTGQRLVAFIATEASRAMPSALDE